MITVVSGKLGSGKSLDTVRMMCEHMRRLGAVRTNINLNTDNVKKYIGFPLRRYQFGIVTSADDPREIPRGDFRGSRRNLRCMVVLDEALNWFDSTASKDNPLKQTWGEWLRQSDKLGQDVYFIAQNFERSAKWIRELAQVNREIIAVKSIRLFGFFPIWFLIPFGSRLYVVRCYDVRSAQPLSTELHYYSPSVWNCYNTAETYGFVASNSAIPLFVPPRFHFPAFWLISFLVSFALLVGSFIKSL